MRLVRVGEAGAERPALIDREGRLRSLAGVIEDICPATLDPQSLDRLRALDPGSLAEIAQDVRYGMPLVGTRKFLAIGLNYSDHAEEAGMPVPPEPIVFMKAITFLAGPHDDLRMPRNAAKIDWEVELGIVVGTKARYVSRERAMGHVAGYLLVNDISDREAQLERGGTWDKGKGHDGFGPIGPWLVTADELGEARSLSMFLDVSGTPRQRGSTGRMIFDLPTIVSYLSEFMTLEPGDIIATGTPPGVGMGMKPPTYLRDGDVMRLGIEGLGEQRQRVLPFILPEKP